jgi:hypothetical protein
MLQKIYQLLLKIQDGDLALLFVCLKYIYFELLACEMDMLGLSRRKLEYYEYLEISHRSFLSHLAQYQ